MRVLEIVAVVLIAVMMLGPLSMAPAYGPYTPPGTAAELERATTPFVETPVEQGANGDRIAEEEG
ncbi:MAG: hypothetical protein NW206_15100 [Hyphomonadaceae bacterium]|nr:hypothetical protein [Hyphomonadaceae bacterium]